MATGLAEPSGAVVDGDDLVVVESAAHRLTRVPLGAPRGTPTVQPHHPAAVTEVAAELRAGRRVHAAAGQKLDDRYGPPTQLVVEATPAALLREGAGRAPTSPAALVLDPPSATACCTSPYRRRRATSTGEFAACHMHRQDWGVPVRHRSRARRAY